MENAIKEQRKQYNKDLKAKVNKWAILNGMSNYTIEVVGQTETGFIRIKQRNLIKNKYSISYEYLPISRQLLMNLLSFFNHDYQARDGVAIQYGNFSDSSVTIDKKGWELLTKVPCSLHMWIKSDSADKQAILELVK